MPASDIQAVGGRTDRVSLLIDCDLQVLQPHSRLDYSRVESKTTLRLATLHDLWLLQYDFSRMFADTDNYQSLNVKIYHI